MSRLPDRSALAPTQKLFLIYHKQEVLDAAPNLPNFTKINLSTLECQLQDNRLGEGRAFLADLDLGNAQYIGFVNARWDKKYRHTRVKLHNIVDAATRKLRENVVLAGWPTNAWWLDVGANWNILSLAMHPTMGKLLSELANFTGMSLAPRKISLWANDFICHRTVFEQLREHWRKCFKYFHDKYGFELPFSKFNVDGKRHPAYFYERVTTIFFANRDDLEVVPIY